MNKHSLKSVLAERRITPPQKYSRDVDCALAIAKKQLKSFLVGELKKHKNVKFQLSIEAKMRKFRFETQDFISLSPIFSSEVSSLFHRSGIQNKLKSKMGSLINRVDDFIASGSSWVLQEILSIRLIVFKYSPLAGGFFSYDLPPKIKNKRACLSIFSVNPQYANLCFAFAILASVVNVQNNKNRPGHYIPHLSKLNLNNLSFPLPISQIGQFEEQNPEFSINVYGWSGMLPYALYVSEYRLRPRVIDLFYYKKHYSLIVHLSRFMAGFFKKWAKKRFYCRSCLTSFSNSDTFEKHTESCDSQGQMYQYPEENVKMKFTKYNHCFKIPFVIIMDLEAFCSPLDSAQSSLNTKRVARHIVNTFSGFRVCSNPEFSSKKPHTYVGKFVIKNLIKYLYDQSAKIMTILNTCRRKMIFTEEDKMRFKKQKRCGFCDRKRKLCRHHDHLTGFFVTGLCNSCNLHYAALRENLEIRVIFHGLAVYDHHHLISEIYKYIESEVTVIPKNSERYSFFRFENFLFLDSLAYFGSSLDNLASNLLTKGKQCFQYTRKYFDKPEIESLVFRKWPYPYEYTSCWANLEKASPPKRSDFYNKITNSIISPFEYGIFLAIWHALDCKCLKDYLRYYCELDVLLLADVLEDFRNACLEDYKLDLLYYFSMSGFAFSAMLLKTKIRLELISDPEMYSFIERTIRGGICTAPCKLITCQNHYMEEYESSEPSSYILYADVKSLYAFAMTHPLPYRGFRFLNSHEIECLDIMNIDDSGKWGYFFEVCLEYPKELFSDPVHRDYPLAPVRRQIRYEEMSSYSKYLMQCYGSLRNDKSYKLLQDFNEKDYYCVHHYALKLYLKHGLVLKKIYRVIVFEQKPWMKKFIEFNAQKRCMAQSACMKDLYKLISNAVYGASYLNKKKYCDYKLVRDPSQCVKLASYPNFHSAKIFNEHLVGIQLKKRRVTLNTPIYAAAAILDISKRHMYFIMYDELRRIFPQGFRLGYSDTDSLIILVETPDVFKIMADHPEVFDCSNFDPQSPYFSEKQKTEIGLLKSETGSRVIKQVVSLKPKSYSVLMANDDFTLQRSKGVPKRIVNDVLKHSHYLDCLISGRRAATRFHSIRSIGHTLYTLEHQKISLSALDNKRFVLDNGIDTLPLCNERVVQ